jgi:hypothetical protein
MKEWVVDGREVDRDGALERVRNLYRNRDEVRDSLAKNGEAARGRLKEVFADILKPVTG